MTGVSLLLLLLLLPSSGSTYGNNSLMCPASIRTFHSTTLTVLSPLQSETRNTASSSTHQRRSSHLLDEQQAFRSSVLSPPFSIFRYCYLTSSIPKSLFDFVLCVSSTLSCPDSLATDFLFELVLPTRIKSPPSETSRLVFHPRLRQQDPPSPPSP